MAAYGYLQITKSCNQKCRFCSNPENTDSISFDQGKAFLDSLAARGGRQGVILTGGEPTLAESLPDYIAYCGKIGLQCKLMTNGQKLADPAYTRLLKNAGLTSAIISIYSVRPETQAFLTGNENSFDNIPRAMENIREAGGVSLDAAITINKYNANHLSENVKFITRKFPFVKHFIFNNLDPMMNRARENTDTIPRLNDFDIELTRAVEILGAKKKTCRVERVPLCYMAGFEYASTETRRIVSGEPRRIFFSGEKSEVDESGGDAFYSKTECCRVCLLNEICAGLHAMDVYYSSRELYPVFYCEKQRVVDKITADSGSAKGCGQV